MSTVFKEMELGKLYDVKFNTKNPSDEIAQLKAQVAMLKESNENWKEGYEALKADHPVTLNNMSNSPEHVQNYIKQSMPNNAKEIIALMTRPNLDECVNRFLGWKLPSDFSPDCGIKFEPNEFANHKFEPTGTNLFNAQQAKAMFQHVLKGATSELFEQPPASQELDGYANRLEYALLQASRHLDILEPASAICNIVSKALQSKPPKEFVKELHWRNIWKAATAQQVETIAKVKAMQDKDVK